jgi:DNA-binding NtrC family response regulator
MERTVLRETLARFQGNLSATAKKLGLNRHTLRHRLKKLKLIEPSDVEDAD